MHKIKSIIQKIDDSIKNRKPFSLIRFGDGGIKLIGSIVSNDKEQIKLISEKEGIPENLFPNLVTEWAYFANKADFIDCPEVYYNNTFWPRCKKDFKPISNETNKKLKSWRNYYDIAGIYNSNFCNPEINYLLCLKIGRRKNIFDLIKDRKICFISPRKNLQEKFSKFCDCNLFKIVSQYENHYEICFEKTIEKIIEKADIYDLWLISAGELGRIYTGLIKQYQGRALDIGFVSEFWDGQNLNERLTTFMLKNPNNEFELKLTDIGKKYLKYI